MEMLTILADAAISSTEFKKNFYKTIKLSEEEGVIAILSRNKPLAYLLSPELYEQIMVKLHKCLKKETSNRNTTRDLL